MCETWFQCFSCSQNQSYSNSHQPCFLAPISCTRLFHPNNPWLAALRQQAFLRATAIPVPCSELRCFRIISLFPILSKICFNNRSPFVVQFPVAAKSIPYIKLFLSAKSHFLTSHWLTSIKQHSFSQLYLFSHYIWCVFRSLIFMIILEISTYIFSYCSYASTCKLVCLFSYPLREIML